MHDDGKLLTEMDMKKAQMKPKKWSRARKLVGLFHIKDVLGCHVFKKVF